MNTVEITGPGTIVGTTQSNGSTQDVWNFPVVINGQAGVVTVIADPGMNLNTPEAQAALQDFLENDPDEGGDLGGIAANDPGEDDGSDMGDVVDFSDDGDSALASNDGDGPSDSA